MPICATVHHLLKFKHFRIFSKEYLTHLHKFCTDWQKVISAERFGAEIFILRQIVPNLLCAELCAVFLEHPVLPCGHSNEDSITSIIRASSIQRHADFHVVPQNLPFAAEKHGIRHFLLHLYLIQDFTGSFFNFTIYKKKI